VRRVCVFCGSSLGSRPAYPDAARRLGEALARRRIGLVYGGGGIGLMGVIADAALAAGGEVIGVIPGALEGRELAHGKLTKLLVVGSMHERKAKMAELSDAFVALPGGLGTLEELAEVLTWAQLGMHQKPCALLDVGGYWRPLTDLLDHAVAERFVRPEHRAMLLVDDDPEAILDRLSSYRPPAVEKWIDKKSS
jgi:uncharacterized protein (TIGR00730 family)